MTIQTKDTITLDMIINEINDIQQRALSNDDYKTALSCILSKAKLLGGGGALERRQEKRENPSPLDKLLNL
jgi:hypothetical protein